MIMTIKTITLMIDVIIDTLSPSCTEQMVSPKSNYNEINDLFLSQNIDLYLSSTSDVLPMAIYFFNIEHLTQCWDAMNLSSS